MIVRYETQFDGQKKWPKEVINSNCPKFLKRRKIEKITMKVAYILNSPNAGWYKVGKMVLPQLEDETHGVDVVGIFAFDENAYMLRKGDPVGERLAKVAREKGILLMICDQCAFSRELAEKDGEDYTPVNTIEGVKVGCFPDLYAALSGNMPDQVISL